MWFVFLRADLPRYCASGLRSSCKYSKAFVQMLLTSKSLQRIRHYWLRKFIGSITRIYDAILRKIWKVRDAINCAARMLNGEQIYSRQSLQNPIESRISAAYLRKGFRPQAHSFCCVSYSRGLIHNFGASKRKFSIFFFVAGQRMYSSWHSNANVSGNNLFIW